MHTARFAHSRLDATRVILEALVIGDKVCLSLPRPYGKLSDQLRRALLGAYLQHTEGVARDGADRSNRLRCARAEASEAAAAIEAVIALGLAKDGKSQSLLELLERYAAMATRLGHLAPR